MTWWIVNLMKTFHRLSFDAALAKSDYGPAQTRKIGKSNLVVPTATGTDASVISSLRTSADCQRKEKRDDYDYGGSPRPLALPRRPRPPSRALRPTSLHARSDVILRNLVL